MIKIVPDANIILTGFLGFNGAPRKVIDLALAKKIILYGSEETYAEFKDIIERPKFTKYLQRQLFTPAKLILEYRTFINMIDTKDILRGQNIVVADADDDAYIRVASACGAKIIVSGDKHLLNLKKYNDIRIISPAIFLDKITIVKNGVLY